MADDPKLLAKQQLLTILAKAGLFGLAAGGTYAAGRSLLSLTRPRSSKHDPGSQLSDPIQVMAPMLAKQADLAQHVPDSFVPMTGDNAQYNWPVYGIGIPLAALAALGGHQGVSSLLNMHRNAARKRELSQAEQQYQDALKQQYEAAMLSKTALDQAYDNFVKAAQDGTATPSPGAAPSPPVEIWSPFVRSVGRSVGTAVNSLASGAGASLNEATQGLTQSPGGNALAGAYLAALAMLGIGGGYAGYQWNRRRQADKTVEKAIAARRLQRGVIQPLYATNVPAAE